MDSRAKFVAELESWIKGSGFDAALDKFAGFLQDQINKGAPLGAVEDMQRAWVDAADNCGEARDDG